MAISSSSVVSEKQEKVFPGESHTDPIRKKRRAEKQHRDSVVPDSLGTVEGAKAHCASESLPLPEDLRELISHKRSWSSEPQPERTGKGGSLLPVRKLF